MYRNTSRDLQAHRHIQMQIRRYMLTHEHTVTNIDTPKCSRVKLESWEWISGRVGAKSSIRFGSPHMSTALKSSCSLQEPVRPKITPFTFKCLEIRKNWYTCTAEWKYSFTNLEVETSRSGRQCWKPCPHWTLENSQVPTVPIAGSWQRMVLQCLLGCW
jgi:hypothetical protein